MRQGRSFAALAVLGRNHGLEINRKSPALTGMFGKREEIPHMSTAVFLAICLMFGSALSEPQSPDVSMPVSGEPSRTAETETGKVAPSVGIGPEEPEYQMEFHDPDHTAAQYQSRYPEGIIRFEVVDSVGNPVQNARLGFTTEQEYRWTAQENAENGTDYSPSEYFAVRIDGEGTAKAELIGYDGVTGGVVSGLPQKLEVRVTQRAADGTQTDSVQWITCTWENTVPAYRLQIDQPNLYAGYAEAEDRVCLRLTRDGEPASNVFVELKSENNRYSGMYGGLSLDAYTGFTDSSGVLYLTQIPEGTYRVYVGILPHREQAASIEVTGEARSFELELGSGAQN